MRYLREWVGSYGRELIDAVSSLVCDVAGVTTAVNETTREPITRAVLLFTVAGTINFFIIVLNLST